MLKTQTDQQGESHGDISEITSQNLARISCEHWTTHPFKSEQKINTNEIGINGTLFTRRAGLKISTFFRFGYGGLSYEFIIPMCGES